MRPAIVLVAATLVCCAKEPAHAHGDHGTPKLVVGEIEIDWREGVSRAQIAHDAATFGITEPDAASDTVGVLPDVLDTPNVTAALAKLRADPLVAVAEPVYEYDALFVPNDPDYRLQWHLQQIGAETAWDWGAGADVTVAVIDTGVSALSDIPAGQLVPGYDFVHHRAEALDDQGHGSHVAGTIAQATNNKTGVAGLAHRAKIMPIKVLDEAGHGTTAHIADAIRWAVDHDAKVLNLSLGGAGYSEVVARAVRYARSHGAVVICAAGNGFGPPVGYPAAYDGAMAVSAVRFDRQLAPYSSYGPEIAIAAPGGDKSVDQNHDGFPDGVLQQTVTGAFEWYQGTSMAAPHVSAAAALLAGAGVTRAEAMESILESTATSLGNAAKFGAGEVDAAAALKHVRLYGGLWRLAMAVLLALGAGQLVRRRDGRAASLGAAGVLGLIVASSGLIALPLLGWGHNEAARLLSTPLPEWGQIIHGSVTTSPLWLSALGPFFILGFSRFKAIQGLAAGLCIGYAAYLAHAAAVGWVDLSWIPGRFLEAFWLGGNAFLAFGLAMFALRERSYR